MEKWEISDLFIYMYSEIRLDGIAHGDIFLKMRGMRAFMIYNHIVSGFIWFVKHDMLEKTMFHFSE